MTSKGGIQGNRPGHTRLKVGGEISGWEILASLAQEQKLKPGSRESQLRVCVEPKRQSESEEIQRAQCPGAKGGHDVSQRDSAPRGHEVVWPIQFGSSSLIVLIPLIFWLCVVARNKISRDCEEGQLKYSNNNIVIVESYLLHLSVFPG